MIGFCTSYNDHGARCILSPGHKEDHDDGVDKWTDAEGLTREQADAALAAKPGGAEFLETGQPFADFLEQLLNLGSDET